MEFIQTRKKQVPNVNQKENLYLSSEKFLGLMSEQAYFFFQNFPKNNDLKQTKLGLNGMID